VAMVFQFEPDLAGILRDHVYLVSHGHGRRRGPVFPHDQPQAAGCHAGVCGRRHDRRQLLVAACTGHRNGRGIRQRALLGSGHGGVFSRRPVFVGVDKILPHLHLGFPDEDAEGIKTSWQRSILLVLAITLHNIPEGLAVGVAFGALAADLPSATFAGAVALALGIGIQNFPEGAAVSVPLRREGLSRLKCFWYGQLSGVVEPIAGVLGAAAVIFMRPILPYALSFAAGAMIYVVVEELIPESQLEKNTDAATMGAMCGFAVMMTLDVALG
jgi:ZIP family zinc transporter